MEQRDSDIFELSKKSYDFDTAKHYFADDENPFMNIPDKQESSRRLNDYDFNILKDGAYKDIADDIFKLEYKISLTEDKIKNIESQINAAEEINDIDRSSTLKQKLTTLKEEYQSLLAIYNEKALSAKITDSFSNVIKKIMGNGFYLIKSNLSGIYELFMSKMPKCITSVFKVRKSLYVLENINKSVDELVTMTIPYGENVDKYKQLSKYIQKANSIQAEISGYLKK